MEVQCNKYLSICWAIYSHTPPRPSRSKPHRPTQNGVALSAQASFPRNVKPSLMQLFNQASFASWSFLFNVPLELLTIIRTVQAMPHTQGGLE